MKTLLGTKKPKKQKNALLGHFYFNIVKLLLKMLLLFQAKNDILSSKYDFVVGCFMNIQEIWETAEKILKESMSEVSYNTWFSDISPLKIENGTVILGMPKGAALNITPTMYTEQIRKAIFSACGMDLNVSIIEKPVEKITPANPSKRDDFSVFPLNPKYTFDQFVVGPNNEFSHAACLAVAQTPATKYNPLFIYGGTGLGKTHLMQAVGQLLKQVHPEWRVTYTTSENFTNELVDAILRDTNVSFREKYRLTDVLLIDDIQFFSKKERTQEEFFHTFNELINNKKQIVLTCDRPPKEIPLLDDRLRTRFESGLLADIQAPDYETRLAILRKKILSNEVNVNFPYEVLDLIATHVKSNIRELEGAVKKIMAYHEISHKDIDLNLANTILSDYLTTMQNQQIDASRIIKKVEGKFLLSEQEIKSSKRDRKTAHARQIAMYLLRELTDMSFPQIGMELGGRDHTTILHGFNKIKTAAEKDIVLLNIIKELIEEIKTDY